MPIRSFERLKDERGLYVQTRRVVVECRDCGKQVTFDTDHGFTDVVVPPELEDNGFTTVLTPWAYELVCKEHLK